ncbi:MAG: peptide ABC transporter substrate-binding protein [Oscillospiraceae bacterium]|nr:peptide ABC transporter substrate-binding protein [Oscillospiraceae bacterium]
MFLIIKNARDIINKKKSVSSLGVKALNKTKLKLELEKPVDNLFYLLSLTPFMPVREDIVDDSGLWAKNKNTFISNGPFCLEKYTENNLVLKKNKFYYDTNKSNINNILVEYISDPNTAYIGYKSNNIDILDNVPIGELKKLSFSDELIKADYYGLYFYSFNTNIDCLKNKKTRQAISKAIDRKKILDKIRKSQEIPANSFLHPDLIKKINKNFEFLNYFDLDQSKKLLKESGFDEKHKFPTIEILYNSESENKVIAEAIQEMLKNNLNINIKLIGQEWSIFNTKRKNLEYNGLVKNSYILESFDPVSFLEIFRPNSLSYTGYNNKNYNYILNNISSLNNKQETNKEIFRALKILEDEMPIIPIFFYSGFFLVKPYIKDYHINTIGYKYFGITKIII